MTSYTNIFHTGNSNQVNSRHGGFAGGRLGLGNGTGVAANNTTGGTPTNPNYPPQHGNTNTGMAANNTTGGMGTPVQQPHRRPTLSEQRTYGAINNGTGFVGGNHNFVSAHAQSNNNGNNNATHTLTTPREFRMRCIYNWSSSDRIGSDRIESNRIESNRIEL